MGFENVERGDFEKIQKANLKRNRTIAITFGVIVFLALSSLVYAFGQHRAAEENLKVANELQSKLDLCVQEAARQRERAEAAAQDAKRQLERAESILRANKK